MIDGSFRKAVRHKSGLRIKKSGAVMLCTAVLLGTASGCGKEPTQDKTVVTVLYVNDFTNLEKLVEDTYPDIDLQCEKSPYTSEQAHRLLKGKGPDLVVSAQPSSDDMLNYLLDISNTRASTAYDGTVMKQMRMEGKTYLIPLPGQYSGYIVNNTLFEQADLPLPAGNQELIEALALLKENGIVGEDGSNFAIQGDYNTDVGMFYVGGMVPDFLGTVEGVQWLAGFGNRETTFSGVWDRAFDLTYRLVDAGVMDPAAIGMQRNAIKYSARMAEGSMAVVFGTSSLYSQCIEENRAAAAAGTAPSYSYSMLPIFSEEGNSPWLIFSPSAYMGVNRSVGEDKREACIRVLELISTPEGQDALTEDMQMGISCLNGYVTDKKLIPSGLETYVESGYFYNVRFPGSVVEYLGSTARMVLGEKLTVQEAMEAVDRYYYEGSDTVDYNLSVIGTVEKNMLLQSFNTRTEETEIGNFLADCVSEAAGAPIAAVNGGGIRSSFYEGEVIGGDLEAVCPYDNLIVVLEMRGDTVRDMLENGVSACTDDLPGGRFLQVSGLHYTFDSSRPAGQRLKEVTLADGSPLESGSSYQVAVNNYMAGYQSYAEGNGDGYTMLNCYDHTMPSGNVTLVRETGMTYRDAMALYFQNHADEAAGADLEGRITDLAQSK